MKITNKANELEAEWTSEDFRVTFGDITIPPEKTMVFMDIWLEILPKLRDRQVDEPESPGWDDHTCLLATMASYDVAFGRVPTEDEVMQGSTLDSRRIIALLCFALRLQAKAESKGVVLRDYLFPKLDSDKL